MKNRSERKIREGLLGDESEIFIIIRNEKHLCQLVLPSNIYTQKVLVSDMEK